VISSLSGEEEDLRDLMESPKVVIRVAREGRSVGAGMATAFPSLLMVLAVC